ncbi:hypothetical protein [Sporosarcina sp. ZBG7A]|uniref:hypothetical protein n=1 Tax=Sporosarcina sp. ZBG7A TaxID=1582223 RepID=UPI00057AA94D|nr:hypothetical protein [Sporosarcina sp. ZBG7A]
MSLASYIGCNIEIPLSDEESTDLIFVGTSYADEFDKEVVKKKQFSTSFVYEISGLWGIEITKYTDEQMNNESRAKLIALCQMMNDYLKKGQYFEFYTCWIGEEGKNKEGELILPIHFKEFEQIEIPPKTLVRFEK